MTKRTICDIVWLAHSPSCYQAEAWPAVRITFDGQQWRLTDGRVIELYPTLAAAAERIRLVTNRVLAHMMRARGTNPKQV